MKVEAVMRKILFLLALTLALTCCTAACSPTESPEADTFMLKDMGPAPELNNSIWLNVEKSLKLADLRGKVVLLEMWTFDCINCQHVMPSLKGWYEKFGDKGLVLIGNHYPEFSYEADLNNLKDAIQRF